jgi:hypothetical protein
VDRSLSRDTSYIKFDHTGHYISLYSDERFLPGGLQKPLPTAALYTYKIPSE